MDAGQAIINFALDIARFGIELVFALSVVIGIFFIISSLCTHVRESAIPGNEANSSAGRTIVKILLAALMIRMTAAVSIMSNTMLMDETSYGFVTYATDESFGRFTEMLNAGLFVVKFAGVAWFFSGLINLYHASSQGHVSNSAGGGAGRGVIKLFFSTLLINIDQTITLLQNSAQLYW